MALHEFSAHSRRPLECRHCSQPEQDHEDRTVAVTFTVQVQFRARVKIGLLRERMWLYSDQEMVTAINNFDLDEEKLAAFVSTIPREQLEEVDEGAPRDFSYEVL